MNRLPFNEDIKPNVTMNFEKALFLNRLLGMTRQEKSPFIHYSCCLQCFFV